VVRRPVRRRGLPACAAWAAAARRQTERAFWRSSGSRRAGRWRAWPAPRAGSGWSGPDEWAADQPPGLNVHAFLPEARLRGGDGNLKRAFPVEADKFVTRRGVRHVYFLAVYGDGEGRSSASPAAPAQPARAKRRGGDRKREERPRAVSDNSARRQAPATKWEQNHFSTGVTGADCRLGLSAKSISLFPFSRHSAQNVYSFDCIAGRSATTGNQKGRQ